MSNRPRRCTMSLIALMLVLGGASVSRAQAPQAGAYSAADYQVIESRNEKAKMRDGVYLMLDIFRPDAEGRFPAVLCQTPYNKDGLATRAKWFAERGYVVVNSDSRGRFNSEGEWDPFSPLHKTDGYDLVEWIAKQPWCNGRVGTYGLSYMSVVARQTIRHDRDHPSHVLLPVIPR